ncbi:hypothetical protein JEP40_00500 [Proteus vulgaris]|uniref:hypothetical protein n=1 Tax=Proteus vulgaris TaxID=585 RepID=UPI0018E4C8EC|nr:hypothetical protein [Proteus vulgaris]MBI6527604.1 hypothetical protein [Proteus vulgaris]
MKNIKKKELIYDGFEDDFYRLNHLIQCPYYDEKMSISVTQLNNLNRLDEEVRQQVINKTKGLTLNLGMHYTYDGLSVMYDIQKSKKENMRLLGLFAIGERQPARYQIIVLGIFRINL